jgi:YD repeat-containing protein
MRTSVAPVVAGILWIALPGIAAAAETITYTYDARGRLVEVERVQPSVTVKTKYTYDKADNRTKKEVTTTP